MQTDNMLTKGLDMVAVNVNSVSRFNRFMFVYGCIVAYLVVCWRCRSYLSGVNIFGVVYSNIVDCLMCKNLFFCINILVHIRVPIKVLFCNHQTDCNMRTVSKVD